MYGIDQCDKLCVRDSSTTGGGSIASYGNNCAPSHLWYAFFDMCPYLKRLWTFRPCVPPLKQRKNLSERLKSSGLRLWRIFLLARWKHFLNRSLPAKRFVGHYALRKQKKRPRKRPLRNVLNPREAGFSPTSFEVNQKINGRALASRAVEKFTKAQARSWVVTRSMAV